MVFPVIVGVVKVGLEYVPPEQLIIGLLALYPVDGLTLNVVVLP